MNLKKILHCTGLPRTKCFFFCFWKDNLISSSTSKRCTQEERMTTSIYYLFILYIINNIFLNTRKAFSSMVFTLNNAYNDDQIIKSTLFFRCMNIPIIVKTGKEYS